MQLSAGHLYWPTTSVDEPEVRPARAHFRCDAMVVGCGVSGALATRALVRVGARVVAVDRRPTAMGSTAASTALVQYELDTPLVKLRRLVGDAQADRAYRATHDAVGTISRLAHDLGRDVGASPRASLYLATRPSDLAECEAEAAARCRIGIDARILSRSELRRRFGLDRPGGILSSEALEINPVVFTRALLHEASAHGAVILEDTMVDLSAIGNGTMPFRFRTLDGVTIEADWVVIASGYEAPEQFGMLSELVSLHTTFAIATGSLSEPAWAQRALIWETGDPYFYCRTCPDGRVLAGGLDEPFVGAAPGAELMDSKAAGIGRWLRDLRPGLDFPIAFRWAGTFARTPDGLPYLGVHQRWPRILFALGYGGNGITFSAIAADFNAAIVAGKAPPLAEVFGFERSGPAGAES